MIIRSMTTEDYREVFALWQITSARAMDGSDSEENIARYLRRNPGMSQVALDSGKIIGTVLAGHDGRRGFIHHMAVLPEYRRHHIGEALAKTALEKIAGDGIEKTHIFCYCDNFTGQNFWKSIGFEKREDIFVFSGNKFLKEDN